MEPTESAKGDRYRYWLTYLPRGLAEGETFKPGEIHLTIIPWLVADIEHESIINSFRKKFSRQPQFELKVGRETVFHFKRKLRVNLFEPSTQIIRLHGDSLEWFDQLGARWAVKTPNVGADYIPHIRGLKRGDKLLLNNLSLVRANRREDGVRKVAAKVEFI